MRRLTLVVLVVIVAGLAWALRRHARALEDPAARTFDRALLDGLVAQDVTALRIDHLARAEQITLERDRQGTWYMTAPVAYPADPAFVGKILEELQRARGTIDPHPDLESLGLSPPEVVLEVTESRGDGALTRRVELGAVDVDPRYVLARVPGHRAAPDGQAAVLRVSRSLFTAVDLTSDTLRLKRITPLSGQHVISFRRRGKLAIEGLGEVDETLDALLDAGGWRRVDPPHVALHPVAMGLLVRTAAELEATSFVDDSATDLAEYGLADPALRVEVEDEAGRHAALRLGFRAGDGRLSFEDRPWFACLEGSPHVYRVDWRQVRTLGQPPDVLYDDQILRAFRQDVQRVELTAEGRSFALSRGDGRWWIQADGKRQPADEGRVADLLAGLEKARIGDFPAGLRLTPRDPPQSVRIVSEGDVVWGGELGGPGSDPASGAHGIVFRRYGDDVAGLVEESLAALVATDPATLRGRDVHRIAEEDVARVSIRHGGRSLAWNHHEDDWYPDGETITLPPRLGVVFDHLLHPVAEEWLDPEDAEPLADPWEVDVTGPAIEETRLTIGRTAAGAVECRTPDGRRALLRGGDGVLEELARLFAG